MSDQQILSVAADQINEAILMKESLLRLRQVCMVTGLSKSSVYAMLKEARFPEPIRLGKRCTRWRMSDVQGWIAKAGN